MQTEKFAERLRQAMTENNVSAKQIGIECGISKGTMSQYLSGKYVAKSERLTKLAQVLGCDHRWLEGQDVPMHAPEPEAAPSCEMEVFSSISTDGKGETCGMRTAPPEYCDGRHFYLMPDGLSIDGFNDGELLLCRRQGVLLGGQTGVFLDEDGDIRIMRYEQRKGVTCLVGVGGSSEMFINEETECFRIAARIILSVREW